MKNQELKRSDALKVLERISVITDKFINLQIDDNDKTYHAIQDCNDITEEYLSKYYDD